MPTKHTPGPWHANRHRDLYYIYDEIGHCVATQVDAADAPLIAAAPETVAERDRLKESNAELLAALESLVYEYENSTLDADSWAERWAIAFAAIAKAKGE